MEELQAMYAGVRLGTGAVKGAFKAAKVLIPLCLLYAVVTAPAYIWAYYLSPPAVRAHPPQSWGELFAVVHPYEWLLKAALVIWNVLLLALVIAVWRWRRKGGPLLSSRAAGHDSHGSATWGSGRELAQPIGRIIGRKAGRLLRYDGDGHLVTVAPTRSGKGVSAVIPNLLDHPGSVVVTDIKGENYAVTAWHRARDLGHEVHAIDPFGTAGGRACFNPLDMIDPQSPHASDDAAMIADMLVAPAEGGGRGDESHWDDEARALLAGVVLHVVQLPNLAERTLPHVRHLLTGTPDELAQLWAAMLAATGPQALVIRRAAARVLQKADRERSGVISTAQRHTHFLDSGAMTLALAHSSFDLAQLAAGRLSLFLVLPPDRLDTHHRWLRLMIACALQAVTRAPYRPAERVLFVLDEFANLGTMAPLVRAVSLLTGYGLSLWLFIQDLAKLRAVYPQAWGSFLANADVLQVFGTNDQFTAEYVSKMSGQSTVAVQNASWSDGRNSRDLDILGGSSYSDGGSINHTGRPLLYPDEVRRLPLSQQLLFVKGSDALRTERVSYLNDPEFVGLYGPNPFHAAGPVPPVGVPLPSSSGSWHRAARAAGQDAVRLATRGARGALRFAAERGRSAP